MAVDRLWGANSTIKRSHNCFLNISRSVLRSSASVTISVLLRSNTWTHEKPLYSLLFYFCSFLSVILNLAGRFMERPVTGSVNAPYFNLIFIIIGVVKVPVEIYELQNVSWAREKYL